MPKKKSFYVFSVYSPVLGAYPYYPFIAENIPSGVRKYIKFLRYRDTVCESPELHIIGTCRDDGSALVTDIEPFLIPQRVEFKGNFISRVVICCECFAQDLTKYLKELKERFEHGK